MHPFSSNNLQFKLSHTYHWQGAGWLHECAVFLSFFSLHPFLGTSELQVLYLFSRDNMWIYDIPCGVWGLATNEEITMKHGHYVFKW